MTQIGWIPASFSLSIKQGSAGTSRIVMTVTNADGTALPSYAGWTAQAKFYFFNLATPITKVPTVVGDPVAKTFTVDITFVPTDTATASPGPWTGDLCMTDPLGNLYYPANFTLLVEPSYAT